MEQSLSPLLLKISFNFFSKRLESLKNRKIEDNRTNRFRLAWLKFVAASMKVNEIKDFLEFLTYRNRKQKIKKIYYHLYFSKFRRSYFQHCWKRYAHILYRKYSITENNGIIERTNFAAGFQEVRLEETSRNIEQFLNIGNPDFSFFFKTVYQLDHYYAEENAKRAKINARITQIKEQSLSPSHKSIKFEEEQELTSEEENFEIEEEEDMKEDSQCNKLEENTLSKENKKTFIISDFTLISSMFFFLISFQIGLLVFH